MARQLVSRLTLALALTSSMAFIGCAEEPKPTETPAPVATPTDPPKDTPAPAGAEKPVEAPK